MKSYFPIANTRALKQTSLNPIFAQGERAFDTLPMTTRVRSDKRQALCAMYERRYNALRKACDEGLSVIHLLYPSSDDVQERNSICDAVRNHYSDQLEIVLQKRESVINIGALKQASFNTVSRQFDTLPMETRRSDERQAILAMYEERRDALREECDKRLSVIHLLYPSSDDVQERDSICDAVRNHYSDQLEIILEGESAIAKTYADYEQGLWI